jgi:methylenetetrahydrofolate reductase (NADPH)
MSFLFRRARQLTPASGKEAVARRRLLCRSTFEIVPMGGVDTAIADLPSQASVAVTCSPVRGIDATLQLAESLAAAGHRPIPHLAARMVES